MQTMASLLLSTSEPSVCIPRVFANIKKTFVKDVFEELFGNGCIERIDMVQKISGNSVKFQRIFVHFKYWSAEPRNQQVRQRLIDGHQIKIVYDDPWFWKCSASRIPKPKDKVNPSFVNEVSETYNSIGEKGGGERRERTGKLQCSNEIKNREMAIQQGLMLFDSPHDLGEMTGDPKIGDSTGEDSTGEDGTGEDGTGEDSTGEDGTGEDGNILGTGWRQVNKKMRGKKNKRGDNRVGRSLREGITHADFNE
jgi:hypothetical protein